MPAFTPQELLVDAVDTVKRSWPQCQPLILRALLVALGLAAVIGLTSSDEMAAAWMALPNGVLTLLVSAGVAGTLLNGGPQYATLAGVLNDQRSWWYVGRLIIIALILLPIGLIMASLTGALAGAGSGAGLFVGGFLVLGLVLWIYARLLTFPYNAFLPTAPNLSATWLSTKAHVLPIISLVVVWQLGLVIVISAAGFAIEGALAVLQNASGLSGGTIVRLAYQGASQILAAFVLDCALIALVRRLQPSLPGSV